MDSEEDVELEEMEKRAKDQQEADGDDEEGDEYDTKKASRLTSLAAGDDKIR